MADNPNWQSILDKLPESVHALIKPELEAWDQNVNGMLQKVRDEYSGYDEFVKAGTKPEFLKQAAQIAEMIRNDPAGLVDRLNQQAGLGYLSKDEAEALKQAQQQTPNDDDDEWSTDGVDIANHPKFKALEQTLEGLNNTLTAQQQRELEAQQEKEYADYLTSLHAELGEFDDDYVTAVMTVTDLDGPSAVEQYRQIIAKAIDPNATRQEQGADSTTPPPVLLDGSPAGGGTDTTPIDFGSMKNSDLNDHVAKMLEAAAANDQ